MPRLSIILAAAAAVLTPAPEAHAQKGGGDNVVILRVCNNTSEAAKVAISYQPVGQSGFYNEGWFEIAPRRCEDLARTTNAYMYAFANVTDDHDRVWAGDHPLCVELPGPYAFWTTRSAYCENHQESRDFVVLQASNFGVFTWNLDP